ncbi:MAG: ferredoxin [Proteobacteria bacterium]|nr:MAG: ferredoxin [Pseudomonadota bacterium]
MSFYKYHLFFCTNQRSNGENCCADFDTQAMRDYAKQRCKALGLHKNGQVRINTAGCLNRCDLSPVAVVYPEGIWYSWVDKDDVDEIIDSHFLNGKPVQRLMLD